MAVTLGEAVDVSRLLEITERPEVKSLLDDWCTGRRHMAWNPGIHGAALHPRQSAITF